MTHEQKPESAEFRTRGEQASMLMQVICDAGWRPDDAHECALRELSEAEARGAAEQRRKDADWHKVDADFIIRAWMSQASLSEEEATLDFEWWKDWYHTLHARPANVAALEARVKELEEENKAWRGAVANALTWLENGRQANARDELKAAQRRAAAIREEAIHD